MSDWLQEVKDFFAVILLLFSFVIFLSGVFFMILDIWAEFSTLDGMSVEERALVNNMLLTGVGIWIGFKIFWIDGPPE